MAVWALAPRAASADDSTGRVAGRALFPVSDDGPVPGASVELTGAARFSAVTDDQGEFAIESVPPGRYRLEITLAGVAAGGQDLVVERGAVARAVVRLAFLGEIIEVEGETTAERMRESAEAVQVIETEQARRESADLGEVLARSEGVGVRRGGGLGSGARISLGGLTGDQIRFFLDGVPLELAGYPFGLANVPVNLVERIEVYRGVVPVRFGADALGGAINLATKDRYGTHGTASYQGGAFGTHRVAATARHHHRATGLFATVSAFLDRADNDYGVDVEVADDRGRLAPARVDRFHDRYSASGAVVEAGLVERAFADRLLVRAFASDYDKELQHNVVMTVPYGEVEYGARSHGASLRYEKGRGSAVSLDAVGGYAYERTDFLDVGACIYDWFGRCTGVRRQPGEIQSRPRDQLVWEHSAFARANLAWKPAAAHNLRASLAPTLVTRSGDERRQVDPDARDPLTAARDLFTLVSGLEYELDTAGDRLESIVFGKHYLQLARSEEALPGGVFRDADRDSQRVGAGAALRYRLRSWLWAKSSYEWATRLPRPDEVFGDGVLVVENLALAPESSHNLNLGVTVDARDTAAGSWRLDVNGFLRAADDLIILLGSDKAFSYDNVFAARALGVEAAAGWSSTGDVLAIDGNVTYQDFRNSSSDGTFGAFEGDRIPNRPYLQANGSARLALPGASSDDEVSVVWNTRYVHDFFRSWESVGARDSKQVIASQLIHSLAVTYLWPRAPLDLAVTAELHNVTDRPAFDYFGVQRPGRAFYLKTTAEL